jgi:hypothetical protein
VRKCDLNLPRKDLPRVNDLQDLDRLCTLVVQLYLVAKAPRRCKTRCNTLLQRGCGSALLTLQQALVARFSALCVRSAVVSRCQCRTACSTLTAVCLLTSVRAKPAVRLFSLLSDAASDYGCLVGSTSHALLRAQRKVQRRLVRSFGTTDTHTTCRGDRKGRFCDLLLCARLTQTNCCLYQ